MFLVIPVGAAARFGRGVINTLEVGRDAKMVAVGGEVGVFVYDALTLAEIWSISSTEPVISLSYSPDGALLAAGLKDGTLALLDAGPGRLLASGSEDGTMVLWEMNALEKSPGGSEEICMRNYERFEGGLR